MDGTTPDKIMSVGTALSASVQRSRDFLHSYGMGLLFTANVFGAGSVYILSTTGAVHGMSLLWVMPFVLFVDLGMHEMSSWLATINKPLMEYIRETIGATLSKVWAVTISFIMHFWSISNYAVTGAALVWITPLNNVYIGVIAAAGFGIAMVELEAYERVEAAISAIILTVFGIYLVLISGMHLPMGKVINGFVPKIRANVSYLALVVGLMGTTVYYPNFFIQSSMKPTKRWGDIWSYRKDNFVGIAVAVVLSTAVIIVSAMTLAPHTPTLTSPGKPLEAVLGSWALEVFVVAAMLASFSSATGTIFGAGFMIPQAWGRDTIFGDVAFRRVVEVFIGMSVVFAILMLEFTQMTPVRLAIVMPAVNGLVGLPTTALALFFANRKYFSHSRKKQLYFGLLVVLMFVLAGLTAESLYHQIVGWL